MDSLVRLFKSVEIRDNSIHFDEMSKKSIAKTLPKGYIFAPEVVANCSPIELNQLSDLVESVYTVDPEQLNKTFHKSWNKVITVPKLQLQYEQMMHYITTYGFDALGVYDKNTIYIPHEKLNIPEITKDVPIVIIHGLTKDQIKEKLLDLLRSGIALKSDTLEDVIFLAKNFGFTQEDAVHIKNKEALILLADSLNIIPEDPVEFLRYVVYLCTGTPMLIKNFTTLDAIREGMSFSVYSKMEDYGRVFGLEKLASIFYRFKPIFLALRTCNHPDKFNGVPFPSPINNPKKLVNRIRRLAVKNHKPMPSDYLNDVTANIKKGVILDKDRLNGHLSKANIFRKIRLAYALKYRTKDVDSILYRIRNGKGYAKSFKFTAHKEAQRVYQIVYDSIVVDLRMKVSGKTIHIPEYMKYSLPATEKQFTGMLPSGSCIDIPHDMVVGVNWHDTDEQAIDLDLSVMSTDAKFGWDGDSVSGTKDIAFSGDITAAPNGATECFYIQKQLDASYIMYVNYYNFDKKIDVPFKIVVGKQKKSAQIENHMIDPNNLILTTNSVMNSRQLVLGLIVPTLGGTRFYFTESKMGNAITAINSGYSENTRKYLMDFYQNTINFNSMLKEAGANVISKKASGIKIDFDLSPEVLEKDTFIDLLIGS